MPRGHLPDALDFLKNKPEQVSGFKSDVQDPYRTFVAKLREVHPTILDEALIELKKPQRKKRTWDELVRHMGNGAVGQHEGCDGEWDCTKKSRLVESALDAQEGEKIENSHFSFGFGLGEASDEDVP